MDLILALVKFIQKLSIFVGIFLGTDARVAFLQSLQNLINVLLVCVWISKNPSEASKIFYGYFLGYYESFTTFITFYSDYVVEYFFSLFLIKKICFIHSIILTCIKSSSFYKSSCIFLTFIYGYMQDLGMQLWISSLTTCLYASFSFFFFYMLLIFLFFIVRLVPYKKKKKYFENILNYFNVMEPFNTPHNLYFPVFKYKKYLKIKALLLKCEIGGDDFKIYTLKKSDLIRDLSFAVGNPFAKSLVVHTTKAQQLSSEDKFRVIRMLVILIFLFLLPIVSIIFYIINFLNIFELAAISCLYGPILFMYIPHYKKTRHEIVTYEYVSGKGGQTILKFKSLDYGKDFATAWYLLSINLNKKFVGLIYWLIDFLCDFYYIYLPIFYSLSIFYVVSVAFWFSFVIKLAIPLLLSLMSFYLFLSHFFSEKKAALKKGIVVYIILCLYLFLFIWFLFAIKFALKLFFFYFIVYFFGRLINKNKEKNILIKNQKLKNKKINKKVKKK